MKTGIFGGSFNPIHVGHIELARELRRVGELDEVWLMVSPQNPLKVGASDMLDERLRYAMARLALHGETGIKASDYELRLPRPTYTWNTLQRLRTDFPERSFTLLIGGDNWENFHRWYRAADITREFEILVYPRATSSPESLFTNPSPQPSSLKLLDVSSTDVRQRVRQGQSVKGLVPPVIEPLVRRLYKHCLQIT